MPWRLFIKEYSPNLGYIEGTKNMAANTLFQLGILNDPTMDKEHFTVALCSELYAFDDEDLPETALPLSYAFLGKAQSTDIAIFKETAKTKSLYSIQPFTGAGKIKELICYNGKIVAHLETFSTSFLMNTRHSRLSASWTYQTYFDPTSRFGTRTRTMQLKLMPTLGKLHH
jgi:hypothetical protein